MMLNKIASFLKGRTESAEQIYLRENHIEYDQEKGYIVEGVVVNELSERLEYFSNRKLNHFNDLKALFYTSIIINEKIDLEIGSGRYVTRLENNEQNLRQMKEIIQKLNDYYKNFKRDK